MPKGIKGFVAGTLDHNAEKNPNWRGGLPVCGCGKRLVSYTAKKCRDCFYDSLRGQGSHYWRGGIMETRNRRKSSIARGGGLLKHETIKRVIAENLELNGSLKCSYCSKDLTLSNYCLEHKTPIKRGGKSNFRNLSIACKGCNNSKGNLTLNEWIRRRKI